MGETDAHLDPVRMKQVLTSITEIRNAVVNIKAGTPVEVPSEVSVRVLRERGGSACIQNPSAKTEPMPAPLPRRRVRSCPLESSTQSILFNSVLPAKLSGGSWQPAGDRAPGS